MNGWIKVHRKMKDSSVFGDPDILRLWLLCLMKATYIKRSVLIDKEEIILEPGQFVTGRKSLSQEYNDMLSPKKRVKETTLWHWMQKLKKWRKIDIKSNTKFSLVTIVNWDEHQDSLTTNQQQVDNGTTTNQQQVDNGTTTNQQQVDTNKKEKEKEKKKKEIEDEFSYYCLFK